MNASSPLRQSLQGYLLTLLAICLLGCGDQRDIRDYYFPARELINTEGKVYAYENLGTLPGPDTIYWYYLGVDLDTALYLAVTRYGDNMEPQQLAREEITNEGVRLRELTLLGVDSAGRAVPTTTDIQYDLSFPFYLGEATAPAGYRLSYSDRAGQQTFVTLDRRYRSDTTIYVLGAEYDAVVFDLAGEVSLRDAVDGDISPSFAGYEVYARGLGLVEYVRNLGAAGSLGGRLVGRVPMPEFAGRVPRQGGR